MGRVRRMLAVSLCLMNSSTCGALLVPGALQSTSIHGRVRAHVSQIASWRGGAVEKGDRQRTTMSTQLGLVRVAGYGIIAGSLCLKTPQIARVWRAKSLVGLAPTSIYADVFLFATSVMYHVLKQNPIRAYGESVIILFQTITMVALMWRFGVDGHGGSHVEAQKRTPAGGGLTRRTAIVLGSVAATALTMRYLPPAMWGLLVVTSTPAILAVQLPQMYKNFGQKHTGELAPLTVLLALLGSSIRTWTTLADLGGDRWLLFNYLLGVVTNGTLLTQIWVYRSRTAEVRRAVEGKAHGAAPAA